MGKVHPRLPHGFADEIKSIAVAYPHITCPWCNVRPASHLWEVDHMVPLLSVSEVVVACRRCNRGRTGNIPNTAALRRLLWEETTVRTAMWREMDEFKELLESVAEERYGSGFYYPLLFGLNESWKKFWRRKYYGNFWVVDTAATRMERKAREEFGVAL